MTGLHDYWKRRMPAAWLLSLPLPHRIQQERWRQKRKRNGLLARCAVGCRHYLQHVAPRCERCNFLRTGRKGWNESEGCHTDKDCNEDRWRTIDAFC